MSEIINKNSVLGFVKNKKFYGVIIAPDSQRFRFDLSDISKKLIEQNGDEVFKGLEANFNYGKEMYEEAEQEKNPYPVTEQFLGGHKDATDSGQSSAIFYLSQKVCQESLDSLEVIIYSEESKEEWHQFHSSLLKYGREDEERRKERRQTEKEHAEYWKGYDKAKAEMRENSEQNQQKNSRKGFWEKFIEWSSKNQSS
jgi:hypothetical protein